MAIITDKGLIKELESQQNLKNSRRCNPHGFDWFNFRLFHGFDIYDLNYFKGLKVLDFGCGPRLITNIWRECDHYAIDPLLDEYKKIEWNNLDLLVDGKSVAGEDFVKEYENKFDVVISANAIDHSKNWKKCIENIARYLKKAGILYLFVDVNRPTTDAIHCDIKSGHLITEINKYFLKIKYFMDEPSFSRNCKKMNLKAIKKLSDEDYIEQYRIMHKESCYGASGHRLSDIVQTVVNKYTFESVLDYGCGHSKLIDKLRGDFKKFKYDPAVIEYDKLPDEKIDLVICTDVLEHIEFDSLNNFINKIRNISKKVIFSISTEKAHIVLPCGLNAHRTILPKKEWIDILRKHFNSIIVIDENNEKNTFIVSTF